MPSDIRNVCRNVLIPLYRFKTERLCIFILASRWFWRLNRLLRVYSRPTSEMKQTHSSLCCPVTCHSVVAKPTNRPVQLFYCLFANAVLFCISVVFLLLKSYVLWKQTRISQNSSWIVYFRVAQTRTFTSLVSLTLYVYMQIYNRTIECLACWVHDTHT